LSITVNFSIWHKFLLLAESKSKSSFWSRIQTQETNGMRQGPQHWLVEYVFPLLVEAEMEVYRDLFEKTWAIIRPLAKLKGERKVFLGSLKA
jgi:hypothetical protein